MSFINSILAPLMKGETVSNPAMMKRGQNALAIATAAGSLAIAVYPPLQPVLNTDTITQAFGIYSALNLYLTTASSPKIGI